MCRKRGAAGQTYGRRRKEDGGVRTDRAKRLEDPEREDRRLKGLPAEAERGGAIPEEAARGNV